MATMAISQEDRIADLRSPAPRHRRCSIRLDWWPMQTNGVRPIEKVNWPPPLTPLANNPPGTGDDARLEFTYRQSGFYSIVVLSSAAGTYTLSVTEQSRHRTTGTTQVEIMPAATNKRLYDLLTRKGRIDWRLRIYPSQPHTSPNSRVTQEALTNPRPQSLPLLT